tara:strand:+ start:824 stop:1384 length:561 start_codon:yes stop_codon:yes gene_type:complete
MKIENFSISGFKIIKPEIYDDNRGYFLESYNKKRYQEIIGNEDFVQDDHSFSNKNVLRGIHFQITNPQEQLIYLASGKVFFVVVDFRPNSKTFLNHLSFEIDSSKHYQIFQPKGVGSGYYTLTDDVNILYKVTKLYGENKEEGVCWNDPTLKIQWPCDDPVVSEKDQRNKIISDIDFKQYPDLMEL